MNILVCFVFKHGAFKHYLKCRWLLLSTFLGIFTLILSSLSTNALAADTQHRPLTSTAVRYLASACANCHGAQGLSSGDAMPNLAGLNADYIREQMHLFQLGKREATVMHQLAKAYSDSEINELATYFSIQTMYRRP
ncbi:MAG: hypothetical protein RI956_277 [Pseudomonadota bacterium]|jgi:cytochrome c553